MSYFIRNWKYFSWIIIVGVVFKINAQPADNLIKTHQKFSLNYEGLKGKVWTVAEMDTINNLTLDGKLWVYDPNGNLKEKVYYIGKETPIDSLQVKLSSPDLLPQLNGE